MLCVREAVSAAEAGAGTSDAMEKRLLAAELVVTAAHFEAAVAAVVPSGLRGMAAPEVPRCSWDDIGGQWEAKRELQVGCNRRALIVLADGHSALGHRDITCCALCLKAALFLGCVPGFFLPLASSSVSLSQALGAARITLRARSISCRNLSKFHCGGHC